VKDDTLYSIPWNTVKIKANNTVATEPYNAPFLSPCINEWCAYVIVAPLDNKITVFNNGSSKGFIGSIPRGGH